MTKKEFFETIANNPLNDEIKNFALKELQLLEKRRERENNRVTKNQLENIRLGEKIIEMLTDKPITIQEITARLGQPNLTNQKISAIMKQLTEKNPIEKVKIKIDKKEKVAYRFNENKNESED